MKNLKNPKIGFSVRYYFVSSAKFRSQKSGNLRIDCYFFFHPDRKYSQGDKTDQFLVERFVMEEIYPRGDKIRIRRKIPCVGCDNGEKRIEKKDHDRVRKRWGVH